MEVVALRQQIMFLRPPAFFVVIRQVVWRGEKECLEVRKVVFALRNFNDDGDSSHSQQTPCASYTSPLLVKLQIHKTAKRSWIRRNRRRRGERSMLFHKPINDKTKKQKLHLISINVCVLIPKIKISNVSHW